MASSSSSSSWSSSDASRAKDELKIWPLDEYNIKLLDEVHPKTWSNPSTTPDDDDDYDLVVIGAGAGGLVSSRQAARRGAKSAMISSNLAGGDCLNVGCVPSKSLLRCAMLAREIRHYRHDLGIRLSSSSSSADDDVVTVDFPTVMARMRRLRATIAPIDGHERGRDIGVNVFQGTGRFVDERTVEVLPSGQRLTFKKAVIATGGRNDDRFVDSIPGLATAPYVTNESLFNLVTLPKRMVIVGSGVVALEMGQAFAAFGSEVTVLVRRGGLFPDVDGDVGRVMRDVLEAKDGMTFLTNAKLTMVETLEEQDDSDESPLMRLSVTTTTNDDDDGDATTTTHTLTCDCLLLATGRTPNIESLQLSAANVDFDRNGIIVDDTSRSISNPNVYSVGDCTSGVPRLTHVSGEMAKVVVQNALFDGDWKLSSLVIPSCMYTKPECAFVGRTRGGDDGYDDVDVYETTLEHNDRAILDGTNVGFVKIFCKKGTGIIVGGIIIAERAGDMINEVTLAMKHGISLEGIGRNIHCYPTTGEAIMMCGLQLINSKWKTLHNN